MAKSKKSMGARAKAKAQKNMNRGGSSYLNLPENTERFKPKKGTFSLDILPYTVNVSTHPEVDKGEQWYQRTFFVHYGIGRDERAFICPKTIKKPCPICDHVKELFNSDDEADSELAKSIKAKERELYNVIDLDDQEKGVQLFEYSYHLFGKALDEEISEGDDDVAAFADLEEGKTLLVSFRKKKLGKNEFFETRKIEFEERDEYDEEILDDVMDLDSLLVIKDADTLQKALFDLDEDDEKETDEDEDEDEDPKEKAKKSMKNKKGKGKKASGKKSKKKDDEDDEEEDEEDEEDEDEEEEEEKSSKKKSSKKSPKKNDKKKAPKKSSKKDSKKKSKKKSAEPDECPHGHEFGEDTDEHDECHNCENWVACSEANEDEED